jgi:hypothetical protein
MTLVSTMCEVPTGHRRRAMNLAPRAALWVVVFALGSALAHIPAPAAAKTPTRKLTTVLDFDSRLKDENGKPVTGIFRMKFELKKPKSKRAMWHETHWVAVDNGKYGLKLGRTKELPAKLDPSMVMIEVAIVGAGTILSEPLSGADASLSQVEAGHGGKRIVQYAEKAGFAYDAEHAGVADRVGPYTGKLLAETIEKLERRKYKVKVSRNRINLTSAGGVGGIPYEQICPPGTVAVGLRGGSGIYIDNVQIVCAPLE